MQLERSVLQYIASEEFCSETELDHFIRLNNGRPGDGPRMIATWLAQGWIEYLGQDDDLPPIVHLTERAYADQPWLVRAT